MRMAEMFTSYHFFNTFEPGSMKMGLDAPAEKKKKSFDSGQPAHSAQVDLGRIFCFLVDSFLQHNGQLYPIILIEIDSIHPEFSHLLKEIDSIHPEFSKLLKEIDAIDS